MSRRRPTKKEGVLPADARDITRHFKGIVIHNGYGLPESSVAALRALGVQIHCRPLRSPCSKGVIERMVTLVEADLTGVSPGPPGGTRLDVGRHSDASSADDRYYELIERYLVLLLKRKPQK